MPDAPRALVACLAQYPRDGECGASDMAFENTVAAAFRVYARCQDQQLAMAAMGGLPLYLDVAEARPAHATAWALLPDASARRGLQAALAQVAAARPPPGWAVAVLAGDRSARVASLWQFAWMQCIAPTEEHTAGGGRGLACAAAAAPSTS